jgi:hypothetical protein
LNNHKEIKETPTYLDLESAFQYVSSAPYGSHRVLYDKAADRFLYQSELTGESDIPEELDMENCVEVPHKNDLDLEQELVLSFVDLKLPDEGDRVVRFFQRAGAYGRFKDLLDQHGLLQEWYDFEAAALRKAIEKWCAENGIEIATGRA